MVRMRWIAAVVVGLVLIGCGDGGDGGGSAAAAPGEFVGKADAEDAYVAISTSNARADGKFDVVAYVCNRQVPLTGSVELAEWFTGSGDGNAIDLRSQSGSSRLKATVDGDRVRGTVELPGARTVSFESVKEAAGTAGLFDVTLDDQGNLIGTSRGGKTLKLAPFQQDGEPGYRGTITSPDGTTANYELFVRGGTITREDLAEMQSPRTIILADGTSRGILDPIARKGSNRSTLSGT